MKYFKTLLLLILSVVGILLPAQSLEGFIPSDATTVASLKLREIFNLPLFKNSQNAKIKALRSKIEKFDFTGGGIPKRMMAIYGSGYKTPAFLIPTTLSSPQLGEKLKKMVEEFPDASYEKITQGNFDGYKISLGEKVQETDSIYVYHLNRDVIAVLMDDSISPGRLQAGSVPNPLAKAATSGDSNELLRITNSGSVPSLLNQSTQGLQQILVTVSKISTDNDSFKGYTELSFERPEAAGQATMMLQMLFAMTAPALFKDNPSLGNDISRAVGFQTKENKVIIIVNLTANLLDKLKVELENINRNSMENNVGGNATEKPLSQTSE